MFSVTDLIGRFGRPVEVIAACLTTASVVTAVAMYIMDKPTRERTALFDAWRMVVHMESRRVSGARAEALAVLLKNRESLAGVDLSNAILDDIDLRGSVLSFASLEDVRFSRVKLNRALLRGASLRNGHFEQRCDFTDAVFDRTQLQGAVLADNTLVRATFSGTEASLTTSFNGADLRSSVTVNAEFSGVNFDNADLSGAKMVEGRVENATFQRATLADFRMAGTFGAGAQFQKSTGLGAVFAAKTVLDQARFDASSLGDPLFEGVSLRKAVFFGAKLRNARFLNADLSGADFTSADLTNAMFCNCQLTGAIFTNAALPPAGLSSKC